MQRLDGTMRPAVLVRLPLDNRAGTGRGLPTRRARQPVLVFCALTVSWLREGPGPLGPFQNRSPCLCDQSLLNIAM